MSTIVFDCDVTEYDIIPKKDNDENTFAINEKCLIINLMDTQKDKIIIQTEIDKKDAIELAKLIFGLSGSLDKLITNFSILIIFMEMLTQSLES